MTGRISWGFLGSYRITSPKPASLPSSTALLAEDEF